jgi:hypothetical protein
MLWELVDFRLAQYVERMAPPPGIGTLQTGIT